MTKNRKRYLEAYLFLVPIITFLAVFKYYPFFTGIFRAFYRWNAANIDKFVGLDNFIELFKDANFGAAFRNILIYSASFLIINLTMPLFAAVLTYNIRNERLKKFFRLGFVVPMVVPMMVIILMWRWIYGGSFGVLNQFLQMIGLERWRHAWLGEPSTALGAIIFINFPWISGIYYLIYLAGLNNIPIDLHESAQIDGINHIQRLWYIDIPLIISQIKLVVMYALIVAMQVFQQPLVLTSGGPGTSTLTPALYMYQQAFTYDRFGYASSIGVILFIVLMALTIINQYIVKETDKLD